MQTRRGIIFQKQIIKKSELKQEMCFQVSFKALVFVGFVWFSVVEKDFLFYSCSLDALSDKF